MRTVKATDLVKDVAALLAGHGFTCFPVLDYSGELVGVVTEADLLQDQFPHDPRSALLRGELDAPPPPSTVSEVMTREVRTVPSTADLAEVAEVMIREKRRCLPVVDGAELVGILTRRDLVRVVGRDDDLVARDIRHRLIAAFGAASRWNVHVEHGLASIDDAMDDAPERHIAAALAAAVPGVLHVDVVHQPA